MKFTTALSLLPPALHSAVVASDQAPLQSDDPASSDFDLIYEQVRTPT